MSQDPFRPGYVEPGATPSGFVQPGSTQEGFAQPGPGLPPPPGLAGPDADETTRLRPVDGPAPTKGLDAGLAGTFLVGAAVTVVLGVYGNVHEPTGIAVNVAGFSGPLEAKVWLTTGAFVLAIVQLVSALVMYGKLPLAPGWPAWGTLHRWSGRLAFLLTIPVAIHCLYAVGFQTFEPRVLAHSLLGCLFYGALTVKLLGLARKGTPGWVLPVLGGTVLTCLVGLWLTSSLWFFTTIGVRF